ncbi:hypothetical protein TorRG33x02_026630, partial [Trema orientale]
ECQNTPADITIIIDMSKIVRWSKVDEDDEFELTYRCRGLRWPEVTENNDIFKLFYLALHESSNGKERQQDLGQGWGLSGGWRVSWPKVLRRGEGGWCGSPMGRRSEEEKGV